MSSNEVPTVKDGSIGVDSLTLGRARPSKMDDSPQLFEIEPETVEDM